ncbi:peptidase family M13 [Cooperia oncophora]
MLDRNRFEPKASTFQADLKLTYTSANSFYDISMAISHWMQERAFLKLDQVNSRDTFDTSVMEVNAFYDGNKNQIAISAGILQSPFFNSSLPSIMNYGAIGVVAGHEVTHAFDDSGASYDEYGNKNDWWDDATYKNFEHKKQCFDRQYGSIFVNDLNVKIDGRRTEGENIADNGGMRAAIRAALRLSEGTSERFTIAGLEDFTQMHYFFMNYAFIWCGSTRRATLLNKLANDVHAPDMYRVNVVLSNQPEFAKTFGCRQGSPMSPDRTCTLW